jgi:outer membrane protein assembly factor BamD (BamD/ComL family)
MPSIRLFNYFFASLLMLFFSLGALGQPDYTVPLNKPAKYKNRTLRSEKSEDVNFTISRRLYQGMVTHYNYYYNANLKMENIIAKAKLAHRDDFTELLPFYNYSPEITIADSLELDSIIFKASAGIVLHDLRNSYIDNLYLLAGKSFFYWQKFDSAYRIFQFVNYRFFPKNKDEYQIVVGGNKRTTKGELNISTKEKKGFHRKLLSRPPSRNDALLWIAKTYAQDSLFAEASALCHLLKKDQLFPKRLHRSLDEVLAYVHYQQEIWDSTAIYLKKALPNATNKTDLSRWEYLLAQLYTKLNKNNEAASYYARAKKHSPDPVLFIHARIYEAQLIKNSRGNDVESTYDELMKLSRRERFDGFEDVLFYAAAGIALQSKDSTKAVKLLHKSASYNQENTALKNKTFLKLGEIYFKQQKYMQAYSAYDSIDTQDPDIEDQLTQIESRKNILTELIKQVEIVQREDSLQRIAAMSEKDRFQYLKKLLKVLRKQRGIKDTDTDQPYNAIQTSNNTSQDAGLFIQTANTGSWYFNNNTQKSKGFTEFRAKWGKRPNVDNWRRQSAVDASNIQQTFMPGNPGGVDGDIDHPVTSANQSTNPTGDEQELSIQSLESDLPLDDTLLKVSNTKIEKALLQQAWIYKNQLEDYPQATRILEELLKRFPNTEKQEEAIYELIYAYKKAGNNAEANRYTSLLNEKYPDSEKLKILTDSKPAKKDINENQIYEEIYNLFRSGNYALASSTKKKADSTYGNKYWTPQLLYVEAISQLNQKEDSLALNTLAQLEVNFPGSEMSAKAATLKDVITRRNEIENYLSNTDIRREEENKLEIPYEEPPTISLISHDRTGKKKMPPSVSSLPPILISLQRPRAGIEIVNHIFEKKSAAQIIGDIKKAGKDSIQIKPLKEAFIDMVYVFNPSEPYLMLVIFEEIDQVYRSEARIAFQRYNSKARGAEDLVVQLHEPTDAPRWLEIGLFPAMASSLGYYDETIANIKTIIPWLGSDKYQMLIISERNLETLKTRKDISEYLLFIRQYIKNKF